MMFAPPLNTSIDVMKLLIIKYFRPLTLQAEIGVQLHPVATEDARCRIVAVKVRVIRLQPRL